MGTETFEGKLGPKLKVPSQEDEKGPREARSRPGPQTSGVLRGALRVQAFPGTSKLS